MVCFYMLVVDSYLDITFLSPCLLEPD
uniref:Uncharacterized protein n=1 Tax=Anguilla anguilla TaxID=7936 RepID=A0A0E9TSX8_ANGAN